MSSPSTASVGPSVDAKGAPVIDPTRNVLDLVDASNQRQDDLRAADDRRVTAEIQRAREAALAGPSLQTYIETRFALVDRAVQAALSAADLRYQQRFDAQAKALEAAFQAAKEAVQAALSAADRAVSKAELANDKRFEALNELRQMLNDVVKGLMTRSEVQQNIDAVGEKIAGATGRMNGLENRMNVQQGESSGVRQKTGDLRATLAIGVSLIMLMIGIATFSLRPKAPDAQVLLLQEQLRELRDQRTAAPPQIIYTPAPPGTQLPSTPPSSVPR